MSLQADIENDGLTDEFRAIMENMQPMSASQQLEGLKDLTPEENGARVSAILDNQDRISTVVKNRMGKTGISSGDAMNKAYGVWGDIFVGTADQDPRDGFEGYETDHYGLTFGVDWAISDVSELGVALTYTDTDVDGTESSSGDNTAIDTYTITGYGSKDFANNVVLEGQASFSYSDYDATRDLTSVSAGQAKGDYNGFVYGLGTDVTKEFTASNGLVITPLVGVSYYHIALDDYTETGSAAALVVNDEDYDSLSSTFGVQIDLAKDNAGQGWTMKPGLHTYWNHEFIDDSYDVTSRFVGGSTGFTTNGMEPDSDTFNVGVDLELANENDWEFTLSYDADIKDEYLGHRGNLRIRKDF